MVSTARSIDSGSIAHRVTELREGHHHLGGSRGVRAGVAVYEAHEAGEDPVAWVETVEVLDEGDEVDFNEDIVCKLLVVVPHTLTKSPV